MWGKGRLGERKNAYFNNPLVFISVFAGGRKIPMANTITQQSKSTIHNNQHSSAGLKKLGLLLLHNVSLSKGKNVM